MKLKVLYNSLRIFRLSADSFDARSRAAFRGAWPLSAPVLLAGRFVAQ